MIPYAKETTYDGLTETTRGAKHKHYLSSKQLYPEFSTGDYGFCGSYLAVPAYQWYWIVLFYTDVYDDEEVDIYFDVKIKYYTILAKGGVTNES